MRVTTLNAGSCDLKADGSGNFFCGTDATGSGGNTGWTTTANTVYNDTSGISVLIGSQNIAANYIAVITGSLNVTNIINATQLWISRTDVTLNLSRLNVSTTLLEGRVVTFNTSATNLDARQTADNASVARTNVQNTFTATQVITGGLNVTTFINATEVWASSRINGSIDCKYLTGGPDSDFCADATSTITNASTLTNVVQSIGVSAGQRSWGNLSFINTSTINVTSSGELTNAQISFVFNNLSLSNLDTRQAADNASVARTDRTNTFAANQIIQGNLNVTGQINTTNYTSTTFKVASCDIKADAGGSLYCGTDATSTLTNATALTDALQAIQISGSGRAWGNVTIAAGDGITLTQSAGLINPTVTIRNSTDVAFYNRVGTFTSNQFFAAINATSLSNFTQVEIGGIAGTANLTVWRSPTALIAAINSTGGAEFRGGLRVSGLVSCDTIDTDAGGNLRCGTDATGSGGGNTGWTTTATTVYNDTSGISVLIGSQNTASGFNTVITGSVNVTGIVNASRLLIRGNSEANITVWESNGAAAVASINRTGNATFAGVRIPNLPNCDTIDTDAQGILKCGADATGGGGGAAVNESGINRTLSVRLASANNSINFNLPIDSNIITIRGRINGTSAATILNITFNGDNQTNYATTRVTTVTSTTSPTARSITPEVTTSALNRSFEFVIYDARARQGVSGGTFRIIQHAIASSTAPIQVHGGWSWVNLTQTTGITSINIRVNPGANFLPGTYMIVTAERL